MTRASAPITLYDIRLELARNADYPEGSARHGYEFVAPLDAQHHIDATAWNQKRDRCRVRRFWEDEEDLAGHLIHRPGGTWAFHYDIHGDVTDDESGYRFANHAFVVGEYVSIREADDDLVTFRVKWVRPLDR